MPEHNNEDFYGCDNDFFAADVNRRVVRDEPEDARIWLEIRLSFCGAAFAYLHCGHYHLFQTQEMVLMYTENGHL